MTRSTKEARAAAWAAYEKRMNDFMTKSDRNTPFPAEDGYSSVGEYAQALRLTTDKLQSKPVYQFHTEAADDNRSLRYNNGKPDYSLIPMAALAEVAKVLEYGASKYARGNWLRPTSWEVSFGCLQRHMAAWQAGEDNDAESGRSHIAHAACNLIQMLHMLENHPEELER